MERLSCLCGCDAFPKLPKSNYIRGHDGRHRGQVARLVLAGDIGEEEALAMLPTRELRAQMIRQVEAGRARQAKFRRR